MHVRPELTLTQKAHQSQNEYQHAHRILQEKLSVSQNLRHELAIQKQKAAHLAFLLEESQRQLKENQNKMIDIKDQLFQLEQEIKIKEDRLEKLRAQRLTQQREAANQTINELSKEHQFYKPNHKSPISSGEARTRILKGEAIGLKKSNHEDFKKMNYEKRIKYQANLLDTTLEDEITALKKTLTESNHKLQVLQEERSIFSVVIAKTKKQIQIDGPSCDKASFVAEETAAKLNQTEKDLGILQLQVSILQKQAMLAQQKVEEAAREAAKEAKIRAAKEAEVAREAKIQAAKAAEEAAKKAAEEAAKKAARVARKVQKKAVKNAALKEKEEKQLAAQHLKAQHLKMLQPREQVVINPRVKTFVDYKEKPHTTKQQNTAHHFFAKKETNAVQQPALRRPHVGLTRTFGQFFDVALKVKEQGGNADQQRAAQNANQTRYRK